MKLRSAVALLALAAPLAADVPRPGSVLVFPLHRSGDTFTLISVTNTRTQPGSDVRAVYQYVNATPDPSDPLKALSCSVVYRSEQLTAGDTVSTFTSCHNVSGIRQGYLVVAAKSATSGLAVSYDHLVGSSLHVGPTGALFSLMPYSLRAATPPGAPTDLDSDGRLDFDGSEYEPLPELLHVDSFAGIADSRLVLLALGPEFNQSVSVKADVYNDNEFPLSVTFSFRCWTDVRLSELSGLFTQLFLSSTPDDPDEVDMDCDGDGDFETGWMRLDAITASTPFQSTPNPPILGAIVQSQTGLDGGRLLWGDGTNTNGQF